VPKSANGTTASCEWKASKVLSKLDATYDAKGRVRPGLEGWQQVIGVAEGLIARASMIEHVPDNKSVLMLQFDRPRFILPQLQIDPDGFVFPAREDLTAP
jgi:hypothetical protein